MNRARPSHYDAACDLADSLIVASVLKAVNASFLLAGNATGNDSVEARAQSYPARPVRIIVGFLPGDSTDVAARLISQRLSERLRQQFFVENRAGAAGNIATEAVVRAAPNGYTLLASASPNAINATLYEHLNFNFIRDTVPIAGIMSTPLVMLVNPLFPAATVPAFIAYAKSNPGKVNMASAGSGTMNHVVGELFNMIAGIKMLHVAYRGGSPAIADLLGGQCRSSSSAWWRGSSMLRPKNCARWRLRARRVRGRCRMSRRWENSWKAARLAFGLASAPPRTRPRPLSSS